MASVDDDSPKSSESSKKKSSRRLKSTAEGSAADTALLLNGNERSDAKIKKKKKKKRRSSTGESDHGGTSDVEANANAAPASLEGGKKLKKKKSKREKRRSSEAGESADGNESDAIINEVDFGGGSSSGGAIGGGDKHNLRDSLTLSKEPKKASGKRGGSIEIDADEEDPKLARQTSVQFTRSTIDREAGTSLAVKILGEDEASGGRGDGASAKSTGSSSSGRSALKKESKYGGGGGVTSKKTSFNDETKDATDSTAPSRGKFELRPSFKMNDDANNNNNNNDDTDKKIAPLERRSSRKDMFKKAAANSSLRNSSNVRSTEPPPRDQRRLSSPPTFSRLSPQDESSSDDEPNPPKRSNSMNELRQRPAMNRRSSLKLITDEEADKTNSERSSFVQKMQTVKNLTHSHQKELRRVKMSMEKQIFIPPKNRNKGIFAAFAHLMAGRVVELVLWTYQAGFGKVMLMFLTFYVVNIFLWAGVMYAVDISSGGRCIHDPSFDASAFTSLERYEFAFELSWTTFTTVGYGAISPVSDVPNCYSIRLVCAFVAFIGVLFGSTTAAIMYSKLMRLLARAHVTFSSTLCVQFGKGNEGSTMRFGQFNFRASVAPAMAMKALSMEDLMDDSDRDGGGGDKGEDPLATSEDGFPVIEFRMVNDRANQEGSEIWDASISGIIQLNKDVNPSGGPKGKATGGESTLDLDKKAYYQFALTPDSHPHFSRIWYARHVLNAESPLLKREIRDMIVQDGGKWDKDFNTASEIRKCLNEFISLRITLSGTSAVSANTVFAEHVYEYEDVVVGWRFANMVYEKEPKRKKWKRLFRRGSSEADDAKGSSETYTKVDKALIHDIVPQPGDDYEDVAEAADHHFGGLLKRAGVA